jgi:L-lactate dehydrogenase
MTDRSTKGHAPRWSTPALASNEFPDVTLHNPLLEERGEKLDDVRTQLESDVRYANITIIEGHDASQYGIGIVSARIAEMVLRDERAAIPVGSYQSALGVTLSLPSVVGRVSVVAVLHPDMTPEERSRLQRSAQSLKNALEAVRK